jgi:Rps23 Pro-64 3,4-dihydroxylase Tpa1-like proline 4-hydroxylase
LLPENIKPKHDGQAVVLSREAQNRHLAESLATAAPQFGQLSASIFINFKFLKKMF